MPIINKPQPKQVPQFRGISPAAGARAAASGASIGQVASSAGQRLIAQGSQIKQAGEQMIGSAMTNLTNAFKTAQLSERLNEGRLTFSEGVNQRLGQVRDKDGNPTFGTLPKDVGQIGQDTVTKISEKISDPQVRAQFKQQMGNFITNKQIQSLGMQRTQQLQYIQEQTQTGIDRLVQEAGQDDPSNRNYYMGQVNQLINSGIKNGALSVNQGEILRRDAQRQMTFQMYNNIIDADPASGHSMIRNGSPKSMGVDQKTFDDLLRISQGALDDQQGRQQQQKAETNNVNQERTNLTATQLDLGLRDGTIGKKDLEVARSNNHINEAQFDQLVRSHGKVTKAQLRKAELQANITRSIQEGKGLMQYTPAQIAGHYKRRIQLLTQNGQPPTLAQKAGLAAQYKGRVTPIEKELEFAALNGNQQDAVQALRAYELLAERNPLAISGLDKDTRAILSHARNLTERTTLSDVQALEQARSIVSNKDPELIDAKLKEFDQIEEFKFQGRGGSIDGLNKTINRLFGGGRVIGSTFISDRDALAIRGLLKDAYALSKDKDSAIDMVKDQLKTTFGRTSLNQREGTFFDDDQVMFMPPEKAYPGIPPEQMRENLESEVSPYLPDGVNPSQVVLRSDELTRTPGRLPDYLLFYRDQFGVEKFIKGDDGTPVRWSPDTIGLIDRAKIRTTGRAELALANRNDSAQTPFEQLTATQAGDPSTQVQETGRQAIDQTPVEPQAEQVARGGIVSKVAETDAGDTIATDSVTGQEVKNSPAMKRASSIKEPTAPIDLAKTFLGKTEQQHANVLSKFFEASGGPRIDPRKTPWCAAFANAVLQASGTKGTGSLAARSFLKWGTPTQTPTEGDIVVLSRGSNPAHGHVGFYAGETDTHIKVLGGNQRDSVSVREYPKSRLLGYRKPPQAEQIQQAFSGQNSGQLSTQDQAVAAQGPNSQGDISTGKPEIDSALGEASKATGVDSSLLATIAHIETGGTFRANARSRTSSASGLFQFTRATWNQMVKAHGKKYGIKRGDIFNPRANAIMAAEFTKDNIQALTKAGFGASAENVYLAHFSGPQTAIRALRAARANPEAPVGSVFSKAAVRANRSLLKGTIGESLDRIFKKVRKASAAI